MNHTPRTEAVPQQGKDRAHFLRHTDCHGYQSPRAPMGLDGIDHSVIVFDSKRADEKHPVVLALNKSSFGVQEYLTAEEARTLAAALLMAASHAEDQDNARRAADFLRSQEQATATTTDWAAA